jgi:ribosomal protein S17E
MKKISLSDIDKHKIFIQNISTYLKEKYPDKLLKCFIHNAPFVFKQIFNIISTFIDKETQKKIELVKE